MSYSAVFCEDEFDHNAQQSTHRAVAIGRFTYRNEATMKKHGAKASFRYLAKMYLSAIIEAEGVLEDIGTQQLKDILAQKEHFEKVENEQIELTDFEYMSS